MGEKKKKDSLKSHWSEYTKAFNFEIQNFDS